MDEAARQSLLVALAGVFAHGGKYYENCRRTRRSFARPGGSEALGDSGADPVVEVDWQAVLPLTSNAAAEDG
jgi:hypothetical protein